MSIPSDPPLALITGYPGWLTTRLLTTLQQPPADHWHATLASYRWRILTLPGFLPESLPPNVESIHPGDIRDLDVAMAGADIIIMLRIQRERLARGAEVTDAAAYHRSWGLSDDRLERIAPQAKIMHPGPVNRGVELSDEHADGPRSLILRQVSLGVALRMSVLSRACGVGPWAR